MKLVSKIDIRIGRLYGPTVYFSAGVPVEVSDEKLIEKCKKSGCTEEGAEVDVQTLATPAVPIEQAIQMLIDSGDPSAFDAHGRPRTKSLKEIMGCKVLGTERDAAWDQMKEVTDDSSE